MLDIMPSSLINYGVGLLPPDTEKVITLNSLSLKFPLFIMYKPEKIKSEPKLPIEICNLSSFL